MGFDVSRFRLRSLMNGCDEGIICVSALPGRPHPDGRAIVATLRRLKPAQLWRSARPDPERPRSWLLVDGYGAITHLLEPMPPPADDECPKCGTRGHFLRMALVCPSHGAFAGC